MLRRQLSSDGKHARMHAHPDCSLALYTSGMVLSSTDLAEMEGSWVPTDAGQPPQLLLHSWQLATDTVGTHLPGLTCLGWKTPG